MEMTYDEEIEARLQLVAARAHRSLTSEEQAIVRTRIKRDLELREEMRTFPLDNGDAPDSGCLPGHALIGNATW
jgi:plasmid stability protein